MVRSHSYRELQTHLRIQSNKESVNIRTTNPFVRFDTAIGSRACEACFFSLSNKADALHSPPSLDVESLVLKGRDGPYRSSSTAPSTKVASICCPSIWGESGILLRLGIRKKVKAVKAGDVDLVEDENELYFIL